jgi:hypothetical protein
MINSREPIIESEMKFAIDREDKTLFYLENSQTYKDIKKEGVKMAEFLLLRPESVHKIWIIEAKCSSPRPETQPNFNEFIQEITEKFANALTLFIASYLKRHRDCNELSEELQNYPLHDVKFAFVLIINRHEKSWLVPLQEALEKSLRPLLRTWGQSDVVVLNDVMARDDYKLIS